MSGKPQGKRRSSGKAPTSRGAKAAKRKPTKTSSFGVRGRISHDSTRFYSSKLYSGTALVDPAEYIENEIAPSVLDTIFCKSSESMDEIPDYSIHLMVTSPPYNVTKEYDDDLTLEEYRSLLRNVFAESYRKLVTGGRACINLANLGRRPYLPLHAFVIQDMLDIGYLMRGEIIWNKASSSGSSTAWGSWRSAANPTLRDVHEYVLVFSKEAFGRQRSGRGSSIGRDEFLEFTKSVWEFPAESARRVGHPAPFPVQLPYRLIQLYTFEGEVVLDPFCGSGQTCIAAARAGRHYVAYDIESEYVRLARRRVRQSTAKLV
jgi:site-specific DNA-methyltransferase (adenine-specific)